ncbi:MAG TPA: hypothetical protein VIJ14_02200 [Rhabdochlamydiaceae bacterium]
MIGFMEGVRKKVEANKLKKRNSFKTALKAHSFFAVPKKRVSIRSLTKGETP